MYPNIDECFMCTNDYNCNIVNDKIVTQVEYLLPEITIIKRGIPLHICSVCERSLQSFNKFKVVSVENSQRLEARLNEAQTNFNMLIENANAEVESATPKSRDHKFEDTLIQESIVKMAQCSKSSETKLYKALKSQIQSNNVETENGSTTVDTNTKTVEAISIKEEPWEDSSCDREFYDGLVQNVTKEEDVVDNHANSSEKAIRKDSQYRKEAVCTYSSLGILLQTKSVEMKNRDMAPITSDQNVVLDTNIDKFEEVFIKEEIPEEIYEDYNNVADNKTKEECIIDRKDNQISTDNCTLKINSEKKLFVCSVCNKSFTRNFNLKIHIQTHAPTKDFPCVACNKEFFCKDQLMRHMKNHTERRKFQCPTCQMFFARKEHLKSHMKTHSDKKEFQCKICNKLFLRKYEVTAHMKVHTGIKEFQCHLCEKMFTYKSNLTAHIKTHYPISPTIPKITDQVRF